MPQDSDPGVISQTLYHQLKRPKEGQREAYRVKDRKQAETKINPNGLASYLVMIPWKPRGRKLWERCAEGLRRDSEITREGAGAGDGSQGLSGFIPTNVLDVLGGDWFPVLVDRTLSHNDDVETRTTGPCLVESKEKSGHWRETDGRMGRAASTE